LTECLAALVDPATGQASNIGHNDGTHLLPLTEAVGGDFRPTLQSAGALFLGSSFYPTGPWDELGLWLGLDPPGRGGPQGPDSFPEAGLHIARGVRSRATLRCARFRTRPSHSDQLHFDLWVDGEYLIRDPGTYRYKAAADWLDVLAGAAGHNAPLLDGREPMERAGRFLWTRWAQARLLGRWRSANGALEALTAEHSGYRSLGILVLRTVVRAGDEAWLIADDIVGEGDHSISCRWLLPDGKQELEGSKVTVELAGARAALEAAGNGVKVGIYRAGRLIGGQPVGARVEAEALGWYSPSYDALVPGLMVAFGFEGSLPQRIETRIVLDGGQAPEIERTGPPGPGALVEGALVLWKNEALRLS
ncbi:MAG: heparinase II/III family protein, partial [Anaerolineales bacterium]